MKFYDDVKNKLAHRSQGFDYIFDYLQTVENPLIVETGCAREEDNFAGDGQSSIMYDHYVNEHGGMFITVDISEESVKYCRSKVSDKSVVVQDDSITFLKKLNSELLSDGRKIDFLYLDSFDAPKDQPQVVQQSALHHLYELLTIAPSLKPGALIAVDDNWYEEQDGGHVLVGKGLFIYDYMVKAGNAPAFTSYQIMWKF
jgi:hypothetical protein